MGDRDECISCMKSLPTDTTSLKCSTCKNCYHLGKCSGVSKAAFKALSEEGTQEWQCSTCKVHERRQGTVPAQKAQAEGAQDMGLTDLKTQISKISEKLSVVLSRIENIEKTFEDQTGKQEALMETVKGTADTVSGIEKSVAFLSSKYDELVSKIESQAKTLAEVRAKSASLESVVKQREAELRELRTAVENAEQYSRRKNIEIHGVEQREGEDLLKVVADLATKLRLPQPTKESIEAVHRLGTRQGTRPPIIVRFQDRNTRELWVRKRGALREEGIFVNENLTRQLKRLLWTTKNVAKERGYRFVWIRNGKLFVRQKEGAAVIRIENENELDKLR